MSNSNIQLVKLKRNVLKHNSKFQLVHDVVEVVNGIQSVDNLKRDPELLLFVCNLIENGEVPKDIDRQELIIEVYKMLFPELNNDVDIAQLISMIEFLKSNKKVKKISTIVSSATKFFGWVAKKIL